MFAANFKRGQERESQLCVYVGERMVVDLWGSAAGDKAGHSPIFFCFNLFLSLILLTSKSVQYKKVYNIQYEWAMQATVVI
jgi:hypothetical protein